MHYISSTYLSCNWKFVHFEHLPPIPPPTGCSQFNCEKAPVKFRQTNGVIIMGISGISDVFLLGMVVCGCNLGETATEGG